jgi:choline dehydrogenase
MPDAADFVGAGSAGCVLADGLSRDHSVVILEAGGSDRGLEVSIPAAFYKLFKTERDWAYETVPEKSANDRRLFLPRGRMLGGSSSMNAMIHIRGRPSDYDGWAASGAEAWGWSSVQPIFKAMESNSRGASEDHGDAGPLRVEDLRAPNPFSERFVKAALEYGMEANSDFNGPRQDGAGFYQVTQRRGRRWSAADAFLRPAMMRPTLEVITGALCTRIVIENGSAVGVEFSRDGRLERVDAGISVVLAAGAFGSPHLLQLSGVGDPEWLASAGVEVRCPSPHVGRHLQDHPVAGVIQRSSAPGTLDDAESIGELARWLLARTGRLTSNVAEAGAFARSDPGLSEPDLQFHFGPVYFEGHGLVPFDGHAFSLGPTLLTPHSEGTVAVVSPDPEVAPAITGNYLADRRDVEALVRGVRMAREIISMPAFDDVRGEEILPGADVSGADGLEAFVRDRFELLYHPVGTCRMGPEGAGVVDPDLRVHGVDRLRVADASVMPRIIGGNTNAATMMIAARAVEMLLGD